MDIVFEWCYETVDEFGDIVDTHFEDTLAAFPDNCKTDTLCLLRRKGDSDNDEAERCYAYLKDGKLPERFEDGPIIPQKFHNELKKHLTNE